MILYYRLLPARAGRPRAPVRTQRGTGALRPRPDPGRPSFYYIRTFWRTSLRFATFVRWRTYSYYIHTGLHWCTSPASGSWKASGKQARPLVYFSVQSAALDV